ncbi:MAG: hypothetical protein J6Z14_14625 [Prevotella sp.]|nr:hypothetical protein [Prevotella sp.]
MKQIQLMNSRIRHIVKQGNTLRMALIAAMSLLTSATAMAEEQQTGVRVGGSVYGGGNLAPVEGDAAVIMSTGTVAGNVFGGGKGKADNFECDKAMVGIDKNDDGVIDNGEDANPRYTLKDGGTTVTITNGTVEGDVYGGGEVGRVERNTIVTIGEAGNTTLMPIVKGHVFGAGQGVETHGYSALVRGNVTVTIQGKAEVWQNVHGGGEKASVGRYEVATTQALADQYHVRLGMPCFLKAGGKCTVNIQDEAVIGKDDIDDSGDVFGAGQGVTPIYNNEVGDVNRSKRMVVKNANHDDNNHNSWDYYEDEDGKVDYSYVWEYFATEADYLQYVETLGRASATDVVIGGKRGEPAVGQTVGAITASSEAPTITGTVYGGSESGFVYYSTEVNIEKGTVNQDVFGGGKGLASFAEAGRVRINTNLTISDGTVKGNVYGGGSLGDVGNIVKNTTDYNYKWKKSDGSNSFNDPHNNTISGTNNNTGICKVEITGGTIGLESTSEPNEHGNVFGAGKGKGDSYYCEKAMVYATSVTIKKSGTSGTVVYGTVYGGGEVGRVEDDSKVIIGTENGTDEPDIEGDVFGAGAGLDTHGYSALVRGNSLVTVQGKAKVGGSVYGGGETASVGRFEVVGGLPTSPKSGGICTVTIQDYAEIETNVYGACKGVTPAFVSGESKSMQTYENRGSSWEYYNENGKEDHRYVWKKYTAENDYLGFLRTLALTSNPYVTISDSATVNGSVFGGGEMGITLGKVVVDILGGTVTTDVYGGGALADTNTANWENGALVSSYPYHQETSISRPSYIKTEVAVGGSVAGLYTRSGDSEPYTYTATGENDTALSGIDYYQLVPGASTTGLYTRTGTEGNYTYTEITDADATADATTDYFALYNTTVNLLSGTVKGDAYGGGLGRIGVAAANAVYYTQEEANAYNTEHNLSSGDVGFVTIETIKTPAVTGVDAVEAKVYGEITVQLGDAGLTDATQFNITEYDGKDIVKSGRVFGCNNLNGSPQGNVKVDVWKTVTRFDNIARTAITRNATTGKVETVAEPHIYDVAAVYGGGNLANYTASGKKTNVIIETCEVSVESVYGGGNAAAVPETDVLVKGAYQIESVFGGGNGRDQYTLDNGTSWENNPGANVNGNANTLLTGGLIHEAYGGSNKKGTITGNVTIDLGEGGDCVLDVGKVVAAGKNADVEGDLVVIMGCKTSRVPLLFAGADDANVNGNVELTITSGSFGQVFGGNNAGGVIRGHIKLNIEETSTCDPIIIDELYLGGNQAAYSQYGYYLDTDGETYVPRTAAMASLHVGDEGYVAPVIGRINEQVEGKTYLYAAPELNITSCTRIDKVFGGGYGTGAVIYGDPVVNINMIQGYHKDGVPAVMSALHLDASGNPNNLGIIGDVYGGGNAADVEGNPTVNIGTTSKVTLHTKINSVNAVGVADYDLSEKDVLGAYIRGNVFGGGKGEAKMTAGTAGEAFLCAKAMIGKDGDGILDSNNDGKIDNPDGGTTVNIYKGFVRGNVYGGGEVGRVEKNTLVTIGKEGEEGKGTSAPEINGNVFGAGAGQITHGYSALVRGKSTVYVQADAKVRGSVYGGGEVASVGRYKVANDGLPEVVDTKNEYSGKCYVYIRGNAEIGPDDMEMTKSGGPSDAGHVFGAGQGTLPYAGYAADAKPKHMDGTRQNDGSWVDNYREYSAYSAASELDADYVKFVKSLALATQTEVTISGNPFIKGSVYGGSENGYVQQDTHVTISGGQIGNGYVQMDDDGTYLDKLESPKTPKAVNRRYTTTEWTEGRLILGAGDREELKTLVGVGESAIYYTTSLPECASWQYGTPYAPYDKDADASGNYPSGSAVSTAEGGRSTGSDGHTFYGNVFGGGSGYYPYKPGRWFEDAGSVYGNTVVDITGGHILTNVYGGNEMTDVGTYELDSNGKPTTKTTSGGKCTINMSGGTIGVPRTLKQIEAHPVTCYLFGAGKGDQRVFFNKSTNVGDVEVNVTGGTIYGSVYGGGEDGHVMRDVELTIENTTVTVPAQGEGQSATTSTTKPKIGTFGTSGEDGNVFGGGRGFAGNAYTAGNVAGSVKMVINGGDILGSVYGGGQLASVGYGLFESTNTTNYGVMQADDKDDNGTTTDYYTEGAARPGRGHIDITISGGTIGNSYEYIIPKTGEGGNTPNTISETDFTKWATTTGGDWDKWKEHNNIPHTEFDTTTGRVSHTKGGNVFAGGMGRMYQLDGTTPISSVDWWKMGCVKSTTLTIKEDAEIKGTAFGGGELGQVVGYHIAKNAANTNVNVGTEVIINGGTIGTEMEESITTPAQGETPASTSNYTRFIYGSVFGGGYGSLMETLGSSHPKYIAGRVMAGTKVEMTAGEVRASVYGGGKMAAVGESKTLDETLTEGFTGDTHVIVSGGTIGKAPVTLPGGSLRYFGGAKMGNVYGGGSGHNNTVRSGHVYGNTNVNISGGNIYHNVYGGGAYGTVGDFTYDMKYDAAAGTDKVNGVSGLHTDHPNSGVATVTITGGTIGVDGKENGMVFGSSRGDINKPGERDDYTAWVYDTHVTIGDSCSQTGPQINGTVYGSGENGHVFNDTKVNIHSGTIGICENSDAGYTVTSGGKTYSGAAYPYRGNVYGGGCGTDKYYSNHALETHDGGGDSFNPLAGIVYGKTTINIYGGHVVRNVYGAGAMGSVGGSPDDSDTDSGKTTINVKGGIIGMDGNGNGNVYGSARGSEGVSADLANVKNTVINIENGADVKGSVFGGGEAGTVKGSVAVNMKGGTVYKDIYGGGALADTNTSNVSESESNTTNVNLTGGTVKGDVYGGGLGRLAKDAVTAVEAKVYGTVLVELNKPETTTTTTGEGESATTTTTSTYGDCVVKGTIFGCNNLNGSPQKDVTVHIYKTLTKSGGTEQAKPTKNTNTYELEAVYGGGNLAAFYPDDPTARATAKANVIIDGCNLTSIQSVYGGGNAASTPETNVTVYGTYEIGAVFGGGNGYDNYTLDGKTYQNPGANVGYRSYAYHVTTGETGYDASTHGSGTAADPYKVFEFDSSAGADKDASTKEKRETNYAYGSGKTQVNIYGGTVHAVYGGSNSKGNVRVASVALLDGEAVAEGEEGYCDFNVDEAYGGGKNADMDGTATLIMRCIKGMNQVYGGAEDADVLDNVVLNITNGTFGQVFGGNNKGGRVAGSITVNIEETGCKPVIIGELYGGGNMAGYSIYGYKQVTENGKTVWKPRLSDSDAGTGPATPYASPVVNVKSFTGIGNIFGGGYGAGAVMVADPTLNINVVKGRYSEQTSHERFTNYSKEADPNNAGKERYTKKIDGRDVYVPAHEVGTIGAIYNVYGGGNAAEVIGTPHVNVGTLAGEPITLVTQANELAAVEGVDIRGNVFGAGNNAEVTGNTDVVIGKNNNTKTYSFTSYSAENDGTAWSSGLARTTGETKNGLSEVVILTNGSYPEFVGQKFYVNQSATANGSTRYELQKDVNGTLTSAGLWVAIRPTYKFTSYGAASGGTQYSTGTAIATGNVETFSDNKEYMQILVLTNPQYQEWVGRKYYVIKSATTGESRYQLYNADGTAESVWVSISE